MYLLDELAKMLMEEEKVSGRDELSMTRWLFQISFIFTPTWGRFPFWLICFRSVETTNQMSCVAKPLPVKSGHQEAFMFTPLKKLTPGTWKKPLGKGETSTNPSILGFHVSFWGCVGDPEKKTFDLPLLLWGVEHRNISVDFLWGEKVCIRMGGAERHW